MQNGQRNGQKRRVKRDERGMEEGRMRRKVSEEGGGWHEWREEGVTSEAHRREEKEKSRLEER